MVDYLSISQRSRRFLRLLGYVAQGIQPSLSELSLPQAA